MTNLTGSQTLPNLRHFTISRYLEDGLVERIFVYRATKDKVLQEGTGFELHENAYQNMCMEPGAQYSCSCRPGDLNDVQEIE